LVKTRSRRHPEDEERLNNKKAILNALAKATSTGLSPDEMPVNTDDTTNKYYTLTQAEMEALISGDIQKIEEWVSGLDRRHAIWLLSHLIKESLQ
jgi:hypothetical protein